MIMHTPRTRPAPWKVRKQSAGHKWLTPFIALVWLFEWTAFVAAARRALKPVVAAKSFLTPASPATRKFSPIPAIPGRSCASLIRTSETSARISMTRNPLARISKG